MSTASASSSASAAPADATAKYTKKAIQAQEEGDWSEAVAMLTLALKTAIKQSSQHPAIPALHLHLAESSLEDHQLDDVKKSLAAFDALGVADSTRPLLVRSKYLRGRFFFATGKPKPASTQVDLVLKPKKGAVVQFPPTDVAEYRDRFVALQAECGEMMNRRRELLAELESRGFFSHYSAGEEYDVLAELYASSGQLMCATCQEPVEVECEDDVRALGAPYCTSCRNHDNMPSSAPTSFSATMAASSQPHQVYSQTTVPLSAFSSTELFVSIPGGFNPASAPHPFMMSGMAAAIPMAASARQPPPTVFQQPAVHSTVSSTNGTQIYQNGEGSMQDRSEHKDEQPPHHSQQHHSQHFESNHHSQHLVATSNEQHHQYEDRGQEFEQSNFEQAAGMVFDQSDEGVVFEQNGVEFVPSQAGHSQAIDELEILIQAESQQEFEQQDASSLSPDAPGAPVPIAGSVASAPSVPARPSYSSSLYSSLTGYAPPPFGWTRAKFVEFKKQQDGTWIGTLNFTKDGKIKALKFKKNDCTACYFDLKKGHPIDVEMSEDRESVIRVDDAISMQTLAELPVTSQSVKGVSKRLGISQGWNAERGHCIIYALEENGKTARTFTILDSGLSKFTKRADVSKGTIVSFRVGREYYAVDVSVVEGDVTDSSNLQVSSSSSVATPSSARKASSSVVTLPSVAPSIPSNGMLAPLPYNFHRGRWLKYILKSKEADIEVKIDHDTIKQMRARPHTIHHCDPTKMQLGATIDIMIHQQKDEITYVHPSFILTRADIDKTPITPGNLMQKGTYRGIFVKWMTDGSGDTQWGLIRYTNAQLAITSIKLFSNALVPNLDWRRLKSGCLVEFDYFPKRGPFAQQARLAVV